MKWITASAPWIAAILFAAFGIAVGCTDLRDHWHVDPTPLPGSVGPAIQPSTEPLTINEAKREVEDVVDGTNRWVQRREVDIAKEESKVAFVEGFASSGLNALGEAAGTWAGPFAPLVALGIGYMTKRRNDRTPDQVREEVDAGYDEGRRDAFADGEELAKAIAAALAGKAAS